MKKCKGCGEEKDLDDFGNDKKAKDGKISKCKECRNTNTQNYKKENKEKISEYNKKYDKDNKELKSKLNKKNYQNKKIIIDNDDEQIEEATKKCSKCDTIKLLDEFGNRKELNGRYKDGHAYICKQCMSESTKEWKDNNKDSISEYNKQYREKNKEKVQAYYKKSDKQKEQNKKIRQQKYFNKLTKIVEQNGGSCLDTEDKYENAYSKILIKCKDGHEWQATLNNLNNNRWCPTCKTYTGELVSLGACNYLFQKPFKKFTIIFIVY